MINEKNVKVASGALAIIAAVCTVAITVSSKADKTEVLNKADRSELNILRNDLNELSAKRREDFVTQNNILKVLERLDAKVTKIEDNQTWQIQQEVKRLQWQSFKGEPQATPSPSVNR